MNLKTQAPLQTCRRLNCTACTQPANRCTAALRQADGCWVKTCSRALLSASPRAFKGPLGFLCQLSKSALCPLLQLLQVLCLHPLRIGAAGQAQDNALHAPLQGLHEPGLAAAAARQAQQAGRARVMQPGGMLTRGCEQQGGTGAEPGAWCSSSQVAKQLSSWQLWKQQPHMRRPVAHLTLPSAERWRIKRAHCPSSAASSSSTSPSPPPPPLPPCCGCPSCSQA